MYPFDHYRRSLRTLAGALLLLPLGCHHTAAYSGADPAPISQIADESNSLALLPVGYSALHILSPNTLELLVVTTQPPNGVPEEWGFGSAAGEAAIPGEEHFKVTEDGKSLGVQQVGYRRQVIYAPLKRRDLRIGCWITLRLKAALQVGTHIAVTNPDNTVWQAAQHKFEATASDRRLSSVIHVNQLGYLPNMPKTAMVGAFLGSAGELGVAAETPFKVIDLNGKTRFSGTLHPRLEQGWKDRPQPYQQVLEANFSEFQQEGIYCLQVPGIGCSYPFRIATTVGSALARTYALGLYHQRCGTDNALPFTRFTHDPCHLQDIAIPVPASQYPVTQKQLNGMSANADKDPHHHAPRMKDVDASLYPYQNLRPVSMVGGHHDAGDYSRYTINSAQLIHTLLFVADCVPGANKLDNLGLPGSGDGKPDIVQEAAWEIRFLSKMQDADGGFYFLVYPKTRAYENNSRPDPGDAQVAFPKNTSATAAAAAALAQAAGSPAFRATYPDLARSCEAQALKAWQFLQKAIAEHGEEGAYQKITHYGDVFQDRDELAWAATELFLTTGDKRYQNYLLSHFDPADKATIHWSWERLFEGYGCAIRSAAFASIAGHRGAAQLDAGFVQKCKEQIALCAADHADWAAASAYATPFPVASKRFRSASWYFSVSQAFDILTAQLLQPDDAKWMPSMLGAINYEAGCNPVNVAFVSGIGYRRQREVVSQYAHNSRHLLPPTGLPIGSVTAGFTYMDKYKKELGAVAFPSAADKEAPYPFYDRWADTFNVNQEYTVPVQARSLGVAAYLMARFGDAGTEWRSQPAQIIIDPAVAGKPAIAHLKLGSGPIKDLSEAQIVWECSDLSDPMFRQKLSLPAASAGKHWIEAEAMLPDGRRIFAELDY
jgi:Glycosyl hydrolase family 9/Cellulase N-terminal ig-like domain